MHEQKVTLPIKIGLLSVEFYSIIICAECNFCYFLVEIVVSMSCSFTNYHAAEYITSHSVVHIVIFFSFLYYSM